MSNWVNAVWMGVSGQNKNRLWKEISKPLQRLKKGASTVGHSSNNAIKVCTNNHNPYLNWNKDSQVKNIKIGLSRLVPSRCTGLPTSHNPEQLVISIWTDNHSMACSISIHNMSYILSQYPEDSLGLFFMSKAL